VLGKHAQTVYEGDAMMLPDMDAIMANIANAIGIKPVRRLHGHGHTLLLQEQ